MRIHYWGIENKLRISTRDVFGDMCRVRAKNGAVAGAIFSDAQVCIGNAPKRKQNDKLSLTNGRHQKMYGAPEYLYKVFKDSGQISCVSPDE